MPENDRSTLELLGEMLERSDRAMREMGLREDASDRPELRLMPTGDDAPPSSDPLHDRLVAAVDALAGPRRRAKLTAVREGGDDA